MWRVGISELRQEIKLVPMSICDAASRRGFIASSCSATVDAHLHTQGERVIKDTWLGDVSNMTNEL